MSYYFWLGIDGEESAYGQLVHMGWVRQVELLPEDDGWITIWPRIA